MDFLQHRMGLKTYILAFLEYKKAFFEYKLHIKIKDDSSITNPLKTSENLFNSVFARSGATKQSSFCLKINAEIASPDSHQKKGEQVVGIAMTLFQMSLLITI